MWSLTLREEHGLQISENKVLSKIFGPKNGEMSRQFRILCNKELCDLYRSPSIVRVVKYGWL